MLVRLFGAMSSPACVNVALRCIPLVISMLIVSSNQYPIKNKPTQFCKKSQCYVVRVVLS